MGLGPSEFGIVNVLKCRPPKNVFSRASAETCHPYLDRQLELLHPDLVVPLGAQALRSLDPAASRITDVAGARRTAGRWTLFPMLHPAATFRSRRNLARWEHDLLALRSILGGV